MNEQSITKITNEITQLLLQKNKDYGGASFDLGLNGNMVHLWDKAKRYKTLIETKNEPNFESIEDMSRPKIGLQFSG